MWSVSFHSGANGARNLALDTELARSYHEAMRALQKELNAPGEITIDDDLASARRDASSRKNRSIPRTHGRQSNARCAPRSLS